MEWRIIVSGKNNPYMNMAVDEAIYQGVAEGTSPPTIRFYDWQPSAFSYGYNQTLEKELNTEKVLSDGYSYVRRPTGGRLVFHDDEVTYAVIAPFTGDLGGSLTNDYLKIAEALQCGFALMGINVELSDSVLSREHQREAKNPCFSSSSRYELTVGKKKIAGSAQVRNNRAFLQHGAILRTNNQAVVSDYLPLISEDERLRVKTYLSKRTTTICEQTGRDFRYTEAIVCLKEGFRKNWQNDSFYEVEALEAAEDKAANSLFSLKYGDAGWNEKGAAEKKGVDILASPNNVNY